MSPPKRLTLARPTGLFCSSYHLRSNPCDHRTGILSRFGLRPYHSEAGSLRTSKWGGYIQDEFYQDVYNSVHPFWLPWSGLWDFPPGHQYQGYRSLDERTDLASSPQNADL